MDMITRISLLNTLAAAWISMWLPKHSRTSAGSATLTGFQDLLGCRILSTYISYVSPSSSLKKGRTNASIEFRQTSR